MPSLPCSPPVDQPRQTRFPSRSASAKNRPTVSHLPRLSAKGRSRFSSVKIIKIGVVGRLRLVETAQNSLGLRVATNYAEQWRTELVASRFPPLSLTDSGLCHDPKLLV